MSQFYGVSPWQTGWNVSGDASGAYMTSSAHGTGWSTSWDEMMGDSARMFQKQEISRPTNTQANGFGSEPAMAPIPAPNYDKPSSGYYEIIPGQTWDSVHQPTMPSKSHYAAGNASPQKAIAKPTPVAAAPVWVEVTSADGWTVPSAGIAVGQAPTTPIKMRQKSSDSLIAPDSPPQYQPSSPNGTAQNGKRHHDIEDELGHQDRYKTELCRSWHESGTCRYGSKCQFAHGAHELRPVMRHPKYKTEPCRSWVETRSCPYGRRCRFIHSEISSSNHGSNSNGSTHHHSNNGSNGNQIHASPNSHHMSHHLNGSVMQGMNGGAHPMNGSMGSSDGVGTRHHSASAAVGQSAGYIPPIERSLSLDGHGQHNIMTHAHMNAQSARAPNGNMSSSPAVLSQRPRLVSADSNGYMSVHSYHTMSPHQQSYQAQFSQHNGSAGSPPSSAMSPNNGSLTSANSMYALNSVLPGSPPYSPSGTNFGFGMSSLFSSSPPLSNSASRENLAAARASNAPWLYDTFQDDDDAEDDEFGNDALPLTPLIEQLNLHAEPVSPTQSHHHSHGAVAPIAPPQTNGNAIGSSPAPPSSSSTSTGPENVATEKGKKKKGSRLHIFQRLSSK